jgi:hypothetical protein
VGPSRGEIGDRGVSSAGRPSCRARYGGSWKNVSVFSRRAPSRGVLGDIGDMVALLGILPPMMVTWEGVIGASLRGASGAVGDVAGVLGSTPL